MRRADVSKAKGTLNLLCMRAVCLTAVLKPSFSSILDHRYSVLVTCAPHRERNFVNAAFLGSCWRMLNNQRFTYLVFEYLMAGIGHYGNSESTQLDVGNWVNCHWLSKGELSRGFLLSALPLCMSEIAVIIVLLSAYLFYFYLPRDIQWNVTWQLNLEQLCPCQINKTKLMN